MLPPLVAPGAPLTAAQRHRYARHLLIPDIGDAGQRRLLAARVLVMGAGGLGSPALLYLAAAGVGHLTIVDDDVVDLTNLQRQVIHDSAAVGTPKVASAAARVRALNLDVEVTERPQRLTRDNALHLLRGHDLVLDGTDNFPTRYVVNDACAELGIPLVWASVYRTQAQVSVFWKNPPTDAVGVDLRDLFPVPPDPATVPSCGDAGVLGALTGQVGSMMATEAIKLICGVGEPLLGRVAFLDVLGGRQFEIPLHPRTEDFPEDDPEDAYCQLPDIPSVSARALAAELASPTPPVVIDVREPAEVALVAIPGTLHVPLADFLAGPPAFDPDADVVVCCKGGTRAERAAAALTASGHRRVRTLTGGVLAWIDDVDPDLPRY